MDKSRAIRKHDFPLTHQQAEAALAGKRVINGVPCTGFDLFPVKHG